MQFFGLVVGAIAPKVMMSLLAAPVIVAVVGIARARVIIGFEIVVGVASVRMFKLHLHLNSVLYYYSYYS